MAQTLHLINGSHQPAFDVLHSAVRGSDKALRIEALASLYSIRCKSKELIPTLMNMLATEEPNQITYVCEILANIGAEAVPTLVTELKNKDSKHRIGLMTALSNIGPDASVAVPTFITILDGTDRGLAVQAASMLPNLGPEAKKAIPHLLAALKIDDAVLRSPAPTPSCGSTSSRRRTRSCRWSKSCAPARPTKSNQPCGF